jgi:transposase
MTRMSPGVWERIPPEAQVIFLQMAETIQRLERRVEELERRLKQSPQNSSLSPSSQHPHAKPAPRPKPSGRKPGGQPGHKKHERALVPPERVDDTIVLKPDACRRCGTRLRGSDPEPLRHQVWDLPEIQPIITEYQRHRLRCACGTTTCAPLPADVPTGQSGPRLVALVTLLMAHFRQSKRRVSLFCESVLNTPCSPGLIVKLQHIGAQALAPCYHELAAALPQAGAVNLDETAPSASAPNRPVDSCPSHFAIS